MRGDKMTGAIKRLSKLTTIVMAAILCLTLLPISVRAEETSEPITLTRYDLDVAKNSYNPELEYGENEAKGIQYIKVDEQSGYFILYESTEYILGENIELNGEALMFGDFMMDGTYKATLNFDEFALTYDTTVSNEGFGDFGAVNVYGGELTVDADGGGVICGDEDQIALLNFGKLIINNGAYIGSIDTISAASNINPEETLGINPETVINDGFFVNSVYLSTNAVINGGEFRDEVYLNYETLINDGEFKTNVISKDCNVTINGGSFGGINYFRSGVNPDATIVINGGNFVYKNNENADKKYPTILAENVTLIVNDAYVENLTEADEEYDPIDVSPSAIYAFKNEYWEDSIVINGGTFIGSDYDYGLNINDYDSIEINGGDIRGYLGAVTVQSQKIPDVSLSGGKFTTYGPEDYEVKGAISLALALEETIESVPDDFFDYMLASGYQFKPKVVVNNMGLDEYYRIVVGTQRDLEVVPVSKVINNQSNDKLVTEVEAIVDRIKKGEIPEGVSEQLAQAILEAINDGKDIDVEMTVTAVNPEDIKDEAKAIAGLVTNTENIAGYYDIKVAVSIDGEVKGFITKFADGVLISLPEPEGLPPLAAGYERVFSLIRIHDGVATKLPAELKDGVINGYSDSYSIYALVYEDVKATPQTGDAGAVLWISLASIFAAAGAVSFVYKKNKVEE
ncbi:MAG: hypothetical protein E7242_11080 [Lachnospiraceae bacterium]|nr:hypothetical protein [Lachnospiraceae bacterium]